MKATKNIRWWIIATIFLATTINYIDRQALSVAAPVIREDLNLSNEQYSWIVSSFLLAYTIMQIISGRLIDVLGTKKGFSIAIVWWSIANMLHAFGSGMLSLGIFRFLLGIGEAGNYPAAMKAISEWFPKEERSKAVGIVNMGPGLGAIIAPPLLAWLIISFGWKMAFVVTGALGFFWLLLWRWIYYEPEQHPKISKEELKLIQGKKELEQTKEKLPWVHYFRYKEVWGLALARFVSDGAFYFFVFWLPSWLADEKGFSLTEIGMFAWIPFLFSDIGSFVGGWTGEKLISKGFSLNASRKWVLWVGAILVVPVLGCLYVESPYIAITLISISLFATQFKQSSLFTLPIDVFSKKDAASVWGITGSAGSFGAMLFTPIIGWLVDTISYSPVFVIVAFLHIISALLIMVFIPRIQPIFNNK
ncbi:ACS family hexuronate transporter-like MFS transporter [Maribacter vaceletii]|uniref:ACS family hexuronate transporter-like MFS transporter n=1 Tax=Maribacter vaceletii TaxID=1206816 RepID=A0A495EE66_9FLAO|nr:MFS transporter [Maribacter vaceletii]RKR15220.1 ACS family hexuronate transporter-like MFS transporter [Maribacter vaceletii]